MKFGMPTLIELPTVEQTASLCHELGLHFVELNTNFPLHQPHLLNQPFLLHLIQQPLVQLQKLPTVHRQRCQTTYSKRLWTTVQPLRQHRVQTAQQSSLHRRRRVRPARQTAQSLRRKMQPQRHLPHLLPILRLKAHIHRWFQSWYQP